MSFGDRSYPYADQIHFKFKGRVYVTNFTNVTLDEAFDLVKLQRPITHNVNSRPWVPFDMWVTYVRPWVPFDMWVTYVNLLPYQFF